jgi:hypothetical protein
LTARLHALDQLALGVGGLARVFFFRVISPTFGAFRLRPVAAPCFAATRALYDCRKAFNARLVHGRNELAYRVAVCVIRSFSRPVYNLDNVCPLPEQRYVFSVEFYVIIRFFLHKPYGVIEVPLVRARRAFAACGCRRGTC